MKPINDLWVLSFTLQAQQGYLQFHFEERERAEDIFDEVCASLCEMALDGSRENIFHPPIRFQCVQGEVVVQLHTVSHVRLIQQYHDVQFGDEIDAYNRETHKRREQGGPVGFGA